MITATIQIEPYLAEYLAGKYNAGNAQSPVRFPDDSDLYHFVFDLMITRPVNCPADGGNFTFYLPCREVGKDPKTYNYFSSRGVEILQKRFYNAFCADLFDFVNEYYYREGMLYIDAIHLFVTKYGIRSIDDESLKKKYYRWKQKKKEKNKKK